MVQKDFPFIVLSGPKVEDPSARRVIRKQAMKDVGEARKRRAPNKKQLQLLPTASPIRSTGGSSDSSISDSSSPSTAGDTERSDSNNDTEATDYDEEVPRPAARVAQRALPVALLHEGNTLSLRAINLFSDYETARSKFMFDLTNLSVLTGFHIGKGTIPVLSADPQRLAGVLDHKEWSYLDYVPKLYGSSPVVTDAANCLLAKTKYTLSPHGNCRELTMRLYSKALRSLQSAISDERTCTSADVLCATHLLSLHELFDASSDAAWSHHIDGCMRLIKHRTPQRFATEFEKALFTAHVGACCSEALMNDTHCFLAQDEWSDLYRSCIRDADFLDSRSTLTITVRLIELGLPGLWHDIGEAINGPQLFDDQAMAELEQTCRKHQQGYLQWMEDYKSHCVRLSLAAPTTKELTMRRELFGTALECLSLIKRLLATVCDRDRISLEAETQALAHLLLDLQKQPAPKHSWLFSGHEVGVAYTAMLTKDDWESDVLYTSDFERRMAIRLRYNTWSKTLRATA